MKNSYKLITGALLCAIISFGFAKIKLGAIRGQISPENSVAAIYLMKGTDTLARSNTQQNFIFKNLQQGVYTLFIKGTNNYRDSLISTVAVKDSSITDMGMIKLHL